jgi:hypothetical protein
MLGASPVPQPVPSATAPPESALLDMYRNYLGWSMNSATVHSLASTWVTSPQGTNERVVVLGNQYRIETVSPDGSTPITFGSDGTSPPWSHGGERYTAMQLGVISSLAISRDFLLTEALPPSGARELPDSAVRTLVGPLRDPATVGIVALQPPGGLPILLYIDRADGHLITAMIDPADLKFVYFPHVEQTFLTLGGKFYASWTQITRLTKPVTYQLLRLDINKKYEDSLFESSGVPATPTPPAPANS